eukprot:1247015-Amphidinium_carterae.1
MKSFGLGGTSDSSRIAVIAEGHVQTLVSKSENDDELVAALRREMGRPPMSANGAAPFQADDAEVIALGRATNI